jgi:ParB family chromosome partitioning protein
LQIEQTATTDLIPYVSNSRTHSEGQVAQIAASIKEFGFNNPILVDKEKGIIAGHGRVLAARKLGMDKVPTVELSHLTETQRKAYIIADNKLALNADWDFELLGLEMGDLQDEGFDLDLVGFDSDEIAAMFPDPLSEYPNLPDGDKGSFQQMTFTLHNEQVEQVEAAMKVAKALGPFVGSPNENNNGNALSRICEGFITQNGEG